MGQQMFRDGTPMPINWRQLPGTEKRKLLSLDPLPPGASSCVMRPLPGLLGTHGSLLNLARFRYIFAGIMRNQSI
jgi:hypothetical protein